MRKKNEKRFMFYFLNFNLIELFRRCNIFFEKIFSASFFTHILRRVVYRKTISRNDGIHRTMNRELLWRFIRINIDFHHILEK